MKKLLFFWNELKATFWFIPVMIIIFSILLSLGLLYIDDTTNLSQEGLGRFFFVNSADSARSILSTISGAMIGVAGTVFSVTLVALTLASSQLGPRLIKNFMYVKLNQIVLGAYISTYLYCLIVLSAMKENNGYTYIPTLSILVAIVAAILNIVLLIVFIHQIAVSIQADKVISEISGFIATQVKSLFPEKMGDEMQQEEQLPIDLIKSEYSTTIPVKCPNSGYLQYIDSESLLKDITSLESLFVLNHRPGDYIVEGMELGKLYTNEKPEKEKLKKILSHFVIGKIKTAQQDLEFSIHQMVEIAVRALSPGVNDPFTAIACIDNLTTTMCYLAQAKFPSQYRVDDKKTLRVIADTLDFEGVLNAAFNQIRQFSAGSTAVMIRLMEALIIINGFVKKESHKKAIIKHAKMTLRLGKQSIHEKNDLKDLTERSKKILGSKLTQ